VLGGGREKKEDTVDPAVGLIVHKKLGERVNAGEPLVTIYYNADTRLREAQSLIETSYRIAPQPPAGDRAMVRRVLGSEST
jgi:pyrimidine-nucleoside phosphorylase